MKVIKKLVFSVHIGVWTKGVMSPMFSSAKQVQEMNTTPTKTQKEFTSVNMNCRLPISKLINMWYFFKYLLHKEAHDLKGFCVKVRALIGKKRNAENRSERWIVSNEVGDCKS